MPTSATQATRFLDDRAINYDVLTYEVAEEVGRGYGVAVAEAIGMPVDAVFKTLIAEADDEVVVAIIPVGARLSTKSLARAVGAKRCALGSPELAERMTGYVVGGVSPFGQRRPLSAFIDRSVFDHSLVAVSGGRRGLQLVVTPQDLVAGSGGTVTDISA